MKHLILLSIICTFAMCSPKTAIKMGDYEQLPNKAKRENYVDKKVTFVASRCTIEHQHMLKTTIDGTPSYICLDSKNRHFQNSVQPLKKNKIFCLIKNIFIDFN